jgi:hypothetical protein
VHKSEGSQLVFASRVRFVSWWKSASLVAIRHRYAVTECLNPVSYSMGVLATDMLSTVQLCYEPILSES